MTYFPHNSFKCSAPSAAQTFATVRQNLNRDILWGQPVFKAPVLPNPRVALDPFAPAPLDWGQTPGSAQRSNGAIFTTARITRRRPRR